MAIPTTMRALEVTSFDGPEAVRIVERPVPEPGPGEVLIKVGAAGVNFADTMQARGSYQGGPPAPYIAGLEASGEVVALGPGESPYLPGAKVFAAAIQGAFAEYVVAPTDVLIPLPEGWTEAQGASFTAVWLTAYACVRTFGRLSEGESVLIHAAAGGVGQAAVRLAKHFGARVFATASTDKKLEVARSIGADELINYTEQDFATEVKTRTGGRGVDLILEMVGGETFRKNLDAIVPYGRIVVFGSASGEKATVDNMELIMNYPIEMIGYNIYFHTMQRPDLFGPMMAEISELIAQGVVRPEEPTNYPLADGARALADLERRKTTGKLVLIP